MTYITANPWEPLAFLRVTLGNPWLCCSVLYWYYTEWRGVERTNTLGVTLGLCLGLPKGTAKKKRRVTQGLGLHFWEKVLGSGPLGGYGVPQRRRSHTLVRLA